MKLDTYWHQLMLALLYHVQHRPPFDQADYVMACVVRKRALDATPHQYADAIQKALATDERLNEILETGHSEELLRQFLLVLLRRIEAEFMGRA